MTDKIEVLRNIRFGERIAEDELNELEKYFVATDQWGRVYSGEVDIIYGSKGAGKSAIYALIEKRNNDLFDRGILTKSAENVRGNTAFSDIVADPPPSERSFIDLWKLYFLILCASTLREYGFDDEDKEAKHLVNALQDAELLPINASLGQFFRGARRLIWSYVFPERESVEHTLAIDPGTGMPVMTRKTNIRQEQPRSPTIELPLDDLIEKANSALRKQNYILWILFDRLDVAFNDNLELERNALRALFRMDNDFKGFDNIKLKIFVRDDIWQRISEGGFAEASHITKTTSIDWSYENLVNLFVKRLLNNSAVIDYLGVEASAVGDDFEMQLDVLERIFPDKVETGNNPETFRWMTNRIQDGSSKSAPRELIHLSETIRQQQASRLERGEDEPPSFQLFDRSVFKPSLREVSKVRYEQTFVAENPSLKEFTDALKRQKSEQTPSTLSSVWNLTPHEASEIAERLVKAGFFERREANGRLSFWVPFIYRDALELVQGMAS